MSFVVRRRSGATPLRPRRFTAGVIDACLAGALVTMSGAPVRAATDTTAPSWGAVTVSPTSIDTSGAPVSVTVTARITDDQSGIVATSGGAYGGSGNLTFRVSSSSQYAYASFTAANRISGTAQDGVYQVAMTVPHYAAQGTWAISSASLGDSAGNSRYASSAADLTAAGLTASFSQTAVGDTTAPTFAGLTFTPPSIDTSAAPRSVSARAHITAD